MKCQIFITGKSFQHKKIAISFEYILSENQNYCHTSLAYVIAGIGKTTLVRTVCEKLQENEMDVQGFYTEELRSRGHREGFDVVTLDGQRGSLARVRYNSVLMIS